MARFLRIPQDSDIDRNSYGRASIVPRAGVVHDTIGVYSGPDSGDSQYIEDHELAHIVVGEDWGEWEQLFDTEVFTAHCNGANRYAFGVEFSRAAAGMPLTEWQKLCWRVIREEATKYHGIPDTYLDPQAVKPASVWVNSGMFSGWISHLSVKTDDGSAQHVDWIPAADFVLGDVVDWNKVVSDANRRRMMNRRRDGMFVAQDSKSIVLVTGAAVLNFTNAGDAGDIMRYLGQDKAIPVDDGQIDEWRKNFAAPNH